MAEDTTPQEPQQAGVVWPSRTLSRRTAEPILYLADRMASADQIAVPREERVLSQIADAVGMPTFRQQPWFRQMTEAAAVARLNTDVSKRAALVVMALVLKADMQRKASEHNYFRRIREALGAPPITVPVDIEEHRKLVMAYFVDSTTRKFGGK